MVSMSNLASSNVNFKNHIALTSCQNIYEICMPLFTHTAINYFTHFRIFKDGKRVHLTSNSYWVEYYFERKLFEYPYMGKSFENHTSGYYFWDSNPEDPLVIAGRDYAQIDHRFTIINKKCDYTDFFGFGALPKNGWILNFYLNNLNFLNNFILYFLDKSHFIMQKYLESPIILPESIVPENHLKIVSLVHTDDLLPNLKFKKIFISNLNVYLSQREYEIIYYLRKSYSCKYIAKFLKLSPRTVETYIDKIKTKLRCRTKIEIMKCIEEISQFMN